MGPHLRFSTRDGQENHLGTCGKHQHPGIKALPEGTAQGLQAEAHMAAFSEAPEDSDGRPAWGGPAVGLCPAALSGITLVLTGPTWGSKPPFAHPAQSHLCLHQEPGWARQQAPPPPSSIH